MPSHHAEENERTSVFWFLRVVTKRFNNGLGSIIVVLVSNEELPFSAGHQLHTQSSRDLERIDSISCS